MTSQLPEPWLRGPISGVHPVAMPFLYATTQAREDLGQWTEGLSTEQLWARPHGIGAIGFHIRHIGGSCERLATYLKQGTLGDEQLAALKSEAEPGATRADLLAELENRLLFAEAVVKALDPRTWTDLRTVGRKALPSTVGGVITHMAEHTQRHVGAAIVTARIVRAL